jgi:hypothetical protein
MTGEARVLPYLESPSALRNLRVVPIDLLYARWRATRFA